MGRIRAPWGLFRRPYVLGDGTKTTVWWYYIYDESGTRHRISTGKISKAAALGEVTRRLREGTAIPAKPTGRTVEEYARKIWDWKGEHIRGRLLRGDLTEGHVKASLGKLKNYIFPTLGAIPIEDVTVLDIEKIMMDQAETLSSSSINAIYMAAKTVWDEAFRTGLVSDDLFAKVRPMAIRNQRREVLTIDQAKALLDRRWWYSDVAWLINLVAATSGARKGELSALMVKDFHGDRLWIGATVRAFAGVQDTTKTGESGKRFAAIPSITTNALKSYLEGRAPTEFIFRNGEENLPPSAILPIRSLGSALAKFNAKNDPLPAVVFHSWRHLVASILSASCGRDAVSLQLGHAVAGVRGVYVHQTEAHIQECLRALESAFSWG